MLDYYEYRHIVGFEETNLVGNVYYVNYIRWQGRCREMFLHEHATDVLADLRADLKLFTLRVDCEFLAELTAFDEVSIRMRLDELTQTQIAFTFDYVRLGSVNGSVNGNGSGGGNGSANGNGGANGNGIGGGVLVARGRQRIACMRGPNNHTRPARVPDSLRLALERYAPARNGRAALTATVGNLR
jgi:acyl-CoA thioesterase FadM